MVSRFAIVMVPNQDKFDAIINRFEKSIPDSCLSELSLFEDTEQLAGSQISDVSMELLDKIGAKIVSPMIIQGSIKGMLIVGKKMNNEEFTTENLKFIEALGNMAISALETERLFQEELEKERLESEIQLALEIQTNLLPKNLPQCKDFDFAGVSMPSRLVGGDYYDFIKLDEDRILIAIADVSGKGMPAALLMANVQAALRALAPLDLPLKELILRINNVVYHNTSSDKFVTFFCGVLNCCERKFRFINAGHNPPLLFKNEGSILPLTEGGMILGITDTEMPYFDNEVSIGDNEMILFYTDGITEAMDLSGRQFGEDTLIELVMNFRAANTIVTNETGNLNNLLDVIVKSVQKHSAGTHQTDDITISAVRVN